MILTNCTDSRRGLTLKQGVRFLEAREMWAVPQGQRDEIRSLFASAAFQRFVDNGVFRLSALGDDEQSTVVKTPSPPDNLTGPVPVEGLARAAGTRTGSLAAAPRVVEYQRDEPETPRPHTPGRRRKPKA